LMVDYHPLSKKEYLTHLQIKANQW